MVTTAPAATRCPHRTVLPAVDMDGSSLYFWCMDCDRRVKPNGFVLESQPLPDELALMDFAARAARRERDA